MAGKNNKGQGNPPQPPAPPTGVNGHANGNGRVAVSPSPPMVMGAPHGTHRPPPMHLPMQPPLPPRPGFMHAPVMMPPRPMTPGSPPMMMGFAQAQPPPPYIQANGSLNTLRPTPTPMPMPPPQYLPRAPLHPGYPMGPPPVMPGPHMLQPPPVMHQPPPSPPLLPQPQPRPMSHVLPPAPPSFLGRAAWERGLGEMLKAEATSRTLLQPKYGTRLLVPKRPKEQQPDEEGAEAEWSDDPVLALDLGVVTITGREGDGEEDGGIDDGEEDEPFVPKGYEAAPPVILRTPIASAYDHAARPMARPTVRPPPSKVTRALRIEHGAPGPYLLREVLVLPRDEPRSGIWVEVEVGGWVFSSLNGQAPALAETEDAPDTVLSGARDRGDVLLPPGPTDARVSVLAEQDAEGIAIRKWLLLRLEGPGVGSPVDMHVHHFVVARRLLATVVSHAFSILNVEAKPFVPKTVREWFKRPCALMVAWPRKPPPFQPRAFAVYLQSLGEFALPPTFQMLVNSYRQACQREQKPAKHTAAYKELGIYSTALTPETAVSNLRTMVQLEELQADQDMSRYDLFSVALNYRAQEGRGGGGAQQPGKPAPLVVTIVVPGAAENRPPLAYGDEVRLRPAAGPSVELKGNKKGFNLQLIEVRAVVLDRKEERVRLLLPPDFPQDAHPPGSRWHIRFTYERFAFRFLHAGLQRLVDTPEGRANAMRFLFPTPDTTLAPAPVVALEEDMGWINPVVNEEQKAAVMAVVNGAHGRAPFCLFGPPGTGKTLTLIEAILQVCIHVPDAKVLAVAPSDVAADIICERLAQRLRPSELFRLNWYSRRFESLKIALLPYSCWDAEAGLFSLPSDPDPYVYVRQRQVVVCTCAASGLLAHLRRPGEPPLAYTHIFVDESSQALQPEILVPLSLAGPTTSVILAGDPKQLGPSTRSPIVSQLGLAKSLQEHLMDSHAMYDVHNPALPEGRRYICKLVKNYRSHQAIIEVPSRLFYEQALEQRGDPNLINSMLNWEMLPGSSASSSVAPPPGLPISPPLSREEKEGGNGAEGGGGFPILFYGVQGEHMHELDSPSFFNPQECAKVLDLVRALMGSQRVRVGQNDLAVITSFRKQVLKLRALLREHGFGAVNVGQVEDFQGQEARVVIISTVLSSRHPNEMQEQLGFLGHSKRFNVAVTRAQALTVIVGNPYALWEDEAGWRQLLEYCAAHGSYRGCDCPMLRQKDVEGVDFLLDAIANESLLGGAAASEIYPTSLEDFFSDSPWRLLL